MVREGGIGGMRRGRVRGKKGRRPARRFFHSATGRTSSIPRCGRREEEKNGGKKGVGMWLGGI
jgi:hypothetical protein